MSFDYNAPRWHFYPRPPGGGRPIPVVFLDMIAEFLSTPSGWRATSDGAGVKLDYQNFYPRPPGGGRPYFGPIGVGVGENFYPRPPGGGRLTMMLGFQLLDIISIHALRVEGDHTISWRTTTTRTFLSTPSGWRATFDDAKKAAKDFDFYPRPPGGGRPFFLNGFSHVAVISIHALRVEGDSCPQQCSGGRALFLSTPSGWRATCARKRAGTDQAISIHALRVEGDKSSRTTKEMRTISIHALRVEGDTAI